MSINLSDFYLGGRVKCSIEEVMDLICIVRLERTALIGAMTLLSAPVNCQEPIPHEGSDSPALSEIIVTGSRIARPELDRLQPTIILDARLLEERGYWNLFDGLMEQPAFGRQANSTIGNQDTSNIGQSYVDFFGLGSQRTLVLVNGRRFVSSNSPNVFSFVNPGQQVDLNVIPTKLIDRVETIEVGGAPIYGSDAVAGVVNIILKHDFEGTEVDAADGLSQRGDASTWRLRALSGQNFADGLGNIVTSAEITRQRGLLGTERPRFAADLQFLQSPGPSAYQNQLFSKVRLGSVSAAGVPMVDDAWLSLAPNTGIYDRGQLMAFSNGATSRLTPYQLGKPDGAGIWNIGGDGVDFAKYTNLLTPQERINGNVLGHFQLTERVRLFTEVWYSLTHSHYLVDLGPFNMWVNDPAGTPDGNLIVPLSNPFLSPADRAVIAQNLAAYAAASPDNPQQRSQFYLARLNQDVQNGSGTADQNVKRIVIGFDGTLPIAGREYSYEVSANYGESVNRTLQPLLNEQNFNNALNAVLGPNGVIVCGGSPVNSPYPTESSRCAPFNPLGYGTASAAALAYVTSLAHTTSTLTQRILSASLSGTPLELPAGPAKFAAGYENRRESSSFAPDAFYQAEAGRSGPTPAIEGAFRTNEFFGEVLLPLISPAMSVPLLRRIEFEGAARSVEHSVAGRNTTWTAGLRVEPAPRVELRGNLTRSIRAPAVTEAYSPTLQDRETADDPCDATLIDNGPHPAIRRRNCAAAGIVQPFVSNVVYVGAPFRFSGDPMLQNEQADARSAGVVLRPVPGTSLSLDYVSIDLKRAIVTLDGTSTLNACYDSGDYPNQYCGRITRNAAGQVTLVHTGFVNAGSRSFRGLGTEFTASFDLPHRTPGALGTLDVRLNHFFLDRLTQRIATGDLTVTQGTVGYSKHKATLELRWHKGPAYALWQTRFVSRAVWSDSFSDSYTAIRGVGSWFLQNATLGYDWNQHLQLQLVVDNVFDKEPPFPVPAQGNGVTTYFSGLMGRYFTCSATYRF
jgi:iron complex outermembrane recepter protein